MTGPIAVIDTDVIVLLLDNANAPDIRRRKSYVELAFENLKKQRAHFVVPSPVIAELSRTGPGSEVIREAVKKALGRVRIEVLDAEAADIAGSISRITLQSRAGRERGAVKYDSLIAAIAHRIGAKWLVTGNSGDYRKALAVINSPVDVIVATEPPARGQQVILEAMARPAPSPSPPPPSNEAKPSGRGVGRGGK
ncbi:MAG TPA: type II toxin-antitoxin system VapC family toxin [Polyangia bacterium]|jgi:predicted nucleic acid-binding protein